MESAGGYKPPGWNLNPVESKGKITIDINKARISLYIFVRVHVCGLCFHRESGLLINWHAETAAKTAHSIIKAYGNVPKILASFETACTSRISYTQYVFWFSYNFFVK